ncbi:tyrosine-type recombinase/integrase [Streptomyces sp. NPDC001777]|uniref:tyrosine-type recombinase/integrase n=1 Tax=Streptomyces sp. NPDC001777 TaxID=3364608 RepID=UPI0036896CB1
MTTTATTTTAAAATSQDKVVAFHGAAYKALQETFPPRLTPDTWTVTAEPRDQAVSRLRELSAGSSKHTRYIRVRGADLLMRWLETFPGESWQQRWQSSTADDHPRSWSELPASWHAERGVGTAHFLSSGTLHLICGDVIRPSVSWLLHLHSPNFRSRMELTRDPEGYADLVAAAGPTWSSQLGRLARLQIAVLLAAKGGRIRDITVGDCLELRATEARVYRFGGTGRSLFYRWLKDLGTFPPDAPHTLRDVTRHSGQVSVADLVDRYQLQCTPVRDLLVDYLVERQPALDFSSLEDLSRILARHFWKNLEDLRPGIDSLRLSAETAAAWKERVRTKVDRKRQPDGSYTTSLRLNYIDLLTAVRAFYLDIAQWAVEEPSRWGPWAAPCPIKANEVSHRKRESRRKARMDQRTRERLPVLPALVRTAAGELKEAQARLEAVRAADLGTTFTVLGETFTKARGNRWSDPRQMTIAFDADGKRRRLGDAELRAFWAWASVEFLRLTGVRIEEMLEVSHHSIIQYKLPTTGEIVPLLQIAPSKTNEERLLLVSPELADVLSTIVSRARDESGKIPLVASYDHGERVWNPPMPLLFQWRTGQQNRVVSMSTIRKALDETLEAAGLTDNTGQPLRYQPHDFRRIFVTDAIMSGLPPHIAQIIVGHKNISTTMGYKAVYPTEAIEAHHAFIARRRTLRPSEEYRIPTPEEWDSFLGHFERRKLSVGTCGRAFGTDCIHEHACVRCPMLRPDPTQRPRLVEIRDNLIARVTEAEQEGWLGEVEGLRVSLAGAEEKLNQLDTEEQRRSTVVHLGMPTFGQIATRTSEVAAP